MITATIGKIFLEAYNKKFGTNYDAKRFFIEVYYPLFFDSNKYLLWINNSLFDQMKKKHIVDNMSSEERKELLQRFISKIENCKLPDASIAPGFPASEEKEFATTSGQVTNLNLSTTKDDFFLSWFGAALGIGIQNGISILFSEPEILMDLSEGWKIYRKALTENEKLLDYKLNTWNGQWIVHRYDKINFFPEQPMAGFNPYEATKDGISIATQSWTKVLIKIAQHFGNSRMMGYVYRFDKTNTTIGFIPINLEQIKRPIDLYKKFFGMNDNEDNKAEILWGTENSFRVCCQKGVIGVEAMQPEGLKKYFYSDKLPKIKNNDEEQIIRFKTYKIWLLAMLNNQELWDKSLEFAELLLKCSSSQERGKKEISQIVEDVLSSKGRTAFIDNLTKLIPYLPEKSTIEDMGKTVNGMPIENVLYFLTLLKFNYELKKL